MGLISKKVALVGIGEAQVGKRPEATAIGLQAEAAKKAIVDSGLPKESIEMVLAQSPYTQPMLMHSTRLLQYLGLSPQLTSAVDAGGASPATMVLYAAFALATGACKAALCAFGENQASYRAAKGGVPVGFLTGSEEFEHPYGAISPAISYALVAQRHMHLYGTTSEQLGAIAVACRKHASMNPNAAKRELITIEDHQSSRLIASPLRLLDCCLIVDGGGAVVLTSAERTRDCRHPPVYLLGWGGSHTHHNIMINEMPDIGQIGASRSGPAAFAMAGLRPEDVDVAEIYDSFTITLLVQLEALGFCKLGEGGSFVEEGRLELGGQLPVNTHGGLLSQGHVDGMLHITEAVSQLRHQAGERQVRDAQVALVTGCGGALSTHITLLLGR